jgi:multiple sugar transport system substrate-binding protein
MRRMLGALGAVTAVTLALSGCGSGGKSASNEVNLWVVSGTATLKPYVDSYNASHPDGQVKLREIQFTNYDSTLAQAFNAKNGPDLVMVNSVTLGTFAAKGQLSDITKVVSLDGDLAATNFYPGFVDATKYKGAQVALPLDTGSRVLQWNKKLFAKAGVAPFGDVVSWTDLVAAAQKIKALGGDYQGFCYAGGQNWLALYEDIGPLVHQAGGSFFDNNLTKSTIDTPQAVKAFDTYKALAATADKSDVVSQSNDGCTEKFGAGTVGMQFGGFWALPSDKQMTDQFELGQSLTKDQSVYSSTGGWTMAVPSYVPASKYANLKTFLTDMYKPENVIKFTGLFPATVNGRAAATNFKDPKYDIYWSILTLNANHPIPLNPALSNQADIVMNALQSVIQGQATDKVLQKAQSDLDATLKG